MRALLLVLVACSSKRDDAPVREQPPRAASAEAIALPAGSGEPISAATTFLRYVDGALVELTRDSVLGDRAKPFQGIDGSGNLHGAFVKAAPHEPPADTSPTAVFVDRDVKAAVLRPAIATLRDRCWGFAVNDHGKLEVLLPEPCPPPARANDRANLDVFVAADGHAEVAITQPPSSQALADLDQLAAFLQQQHEQSDYLTGRADLDLAVDAETTVGRLTMLLVRAHVAGFKAAAWVAKLATR